MFKSLFEEGIPVTPYT